MCYSLLARPVSSSSATRSGGGGVNGANGGSELMAADGRVPLSDLREALTEVTAEWGFTPDALEEVSARNAQRGSGAGLGQRRWRRPPCGPVYICT